MSSSEPLSLRILCFGDSLTEGYSNYGMSMTPYSTVLQTSPKLWGGDVKRIVKVFTKGMSGDLVTGAFEKRMRRMYSPTSPTPLYNYTIFLGGTNDLAYGIPPTTIFASIQSMTSIALSRGSKILLLTVPECASKNARLDANRAELNALIMGDTREGVKVFDLHEVMPYHSLSEEEREELWDDGLHFTPKGYEKMGELIAGRVVELLKDEAVASS